MTSHPDGSLVESRLGRVLGRGDPRPFQVCSVRRVWSTACLIHDETAHGGLSPQSFGGSHLCHDLRDLHRGRTLLESLVDCLA